MKFLVDNAPKSIKATNLKDYNGRLIAIDATMVIYQSLFAIRQTDGKLLSTTDGKVTRLVFVGKHI